jgi:hypothetical protein
MVIPRRKAPLKAKINFSPLEVLGFAIKAIVIPKPAPIKGKINPKEDTVSIL